MQLPGFERREKEIGLHGCYSSDGGGRVGHQSSCPTRSRTRGLLHCASLARPVMLWVEHSGFEQALTAPMACQAARVPPSSSPRTNLSASHSSSLVLWTRQQQCAQTVIVVSRAEPRVWK